MSDNASASEGHDSNVAASIRALEEKISRRLDAIESKIGNNGPIAPVASAAVPDKKSTSFLLSNWYKFSNWSKRILRPFVVSDLYKRILETIQVCAVIAGFSFTVWGLGRLQESTDIGSYNSVSSEWLKVDQYFRDNPGMRKYFYSGEPLPANEEERQKVEAAAHYVLNFLDYAINASHHLKEQYPDNKTFIDHGVWETYIQKTFLTSPAVCAVLATIPDGYSKPTKELAVEVCPTGQTRTTVEFLQAAMVGNLFVVESSRLALTGAVSAEVKGFARQVLDGHDARAAQLSEAIDKAKVAPSPSKLDAKRQTLCNELKTKQGADFDKAYLDSLYAAHVEAVRLFKDYVAAGGKADVRSVAGEILPTLQKRLYEIARLRTENSG
jgi:putative membrane protein